MKPAEDSVFLPDRTLGKGVKVMADEVVNGEYGLVINGHSLVRQKFLITMHAVIVLCDLCCLLLR